MSTENIPVDTAPSENGAFTQLLAAGAHFDLESIPMYRRLGYLRHNETLPGSEDSYICLYWEDTKEQIKEKAFLMFFPRDGFFRDRWYVTYEVTSTHNFEIVSGPESE